MNIFTTFTTTLFCGSGEASTPLSAQCLAWLDRQISALVAKLVDELSALQLPGLKPALQVVYSGNPCDA
ncbi:MAG: hypothetical protein U0175_04470 [Caldilineaceae bacterium]